jgi:hypothetical protein
MMEEQKLYLHKTDGGAEYLCTEEDNLRTAVVRLDGEPVLLVKDNKDEDDTINIIWHIADVNEVVPNLTEKQSKTLSRL